MGGKNKYDINVYLNKLASLLELDNNTILLHYQIGTDLASDKANVRNFSCRNSDYPEDSVNFWEALKGLSWKPALVTVTCIGIFYSLLTFNLARKIIYI